MHRKRAELIERMRAVAGDPDSGWSVIGPGTVRWSQELPTPSWVGAAQWPGTTYTRHVFVTLVSLTSAPIVRVARAPWVRASDVSTSLAKALDLLADPAVVFE